MVVLPATRLGGGFDDLRGCPPTLLGCLAQVARSELAVCLLQEGPALFSICELRDHFDAQEGSGGNGGIRTCDLALMKRPLCR